MTLDAEKYHQYVRKNLELIVETLARISVSDFSKRLYIPMLPDDEFTEVFCGLDLLMDDLSEARAELEEENAISRLRTEIWKQAVVGLKDIGRVIQDLLDAVGPRVHTAGVCYLEIESSSRDAVCTQEWVKSGGTPIIGMRVPASLWAALDEHEFIQIRCGEIKSAGGLNVQLVDFMRRSGIGAICAAFCGSQAKPFGLVAFADRNEQRIWLDRERLLLLELANIISAKTTQAQSADALREQKLESLGTLAGGLAHDFNNILTGIVGNISLAKDALSQGSETLALLEHAEQAALRARRLTGQFLTFSTGGTPVKEHADLREIIESCAPFCLSGSNVTYTFDIAPDLNPVEVDRGQIEQALTNLYINAKQAMPGGGQLRIHAGNVLLENDRSIPLAPGKYVRVIVSDAGVGIPRHNLQRVFDPYFTTKTQGIGLGLAAVYSIIVKHGGHIQCDSDGRRGATFTFYLPCSDGPKPAAKASTMLQQPRGRGRVLVMDDDDLVRLTVERLLKAGGFETVAVKNGQEALAVYSEARSNQPFSLVIMDLTVVGGDGGRETIGKLLTIDPKARAIVTSGYSNDPVMSNCRKYGFRGVIQKPFEVNEFFSVINSVLAD